LKQKEGGPINFQTTKRRKKKNQTLRDKNETGEEFLPKKGERNPRTTKKGVYKQQKKTNRESKSNKEGRIASHKVKGREGRKNKQRKPTTRHKKKNEWQRGSENLHGKESPELVKKMRRQSVRDPRGRQRRHLQVEEKKIVLRQRGKRKRTKTPYQSKGRNNPKGKNWVQGERNIRNQERN